MSKGSGALGDERVERVVGRLHEAAKADRPKFLGLLPSVLWARLTGKSFDEVVTPERMKEFYIPISREQGVFTYLTARAIGARTVVEFGTSFGISTLYLAAAVRDNGGGIVIGTEVEAGKHAAARANLEEAGLADLVDVRLGDARETLRETPEPVDLVLLDGWKDLYLPILQLLEPRLRPGSVVLGDNIFTFRKGLRPYVEYLQAAGSHYRSHTLRLADGYEYSVFTG